MVSLSGILVNREGNTETCLEKIVETFPPVVVAGIHVDCEIVTKRCSAGVLGPDLHDADIAGDVFDGEAGIVAISLDVKENGVLATNTFSLFGRCTKQIDGAAIVMAGAGLFADDGDSGDGWLATDGGD